MIYPDDMTPAEIEEFNRDLENWYNDLEDEFHSVNMELTTIIGE